MSMLPRINTQGFSSLGFASRPMSPLPLSPANKVVQPARTSSQDANADSSVRKRVCKACDRCRLKKSKCDGANPCSRCKADNAICVFGERKKSHDKVYPKGYVEMLEQQQGQLVSGLQEMYHRLLKVQAWAGPALAEHSGYPLTHDILAALNLLEAKHDGSGELDTFEDDCQKLQSRLLAEGMGYTRRRGSLSSDSEHSQHEHSRSSSSGTPTCSRSVFRESFHFSNPPSPATRSPGSRQQPRSHAPVQHSPLEPTSPLANDPQFYQADWATSDLSPEQMLRHKLTVANPDMQQSLSEIESILASGNFDHQTVGFDGSFSGLAPFPQQLSSSFGPTIAGVNDWTLDQMDVDFTKYISVNT